MSDPLQLSPQTIVRLQKHAKPFIDTVDSVVNRLLDEYEQLSDAGEVDIPASGSLINFNPASPPSLTHTKVHSIEFNGSKFHPAATNWNSLVNAAVRAARKATKSDDELRRLVPANLKFGKKEDEGYRYLADINLSVQGQDANAAWKTAFQIATKLGIKFELIFSWRMRDDAAHPGETGRFSNKIRRRWV